MEEEKGWKQLLIEPTAEILARPYGLYFPLIFVGSTREKSHKDCKEIAADL